MVDLVATHGPQRLNTPPVDSSKHVGLTLDPT